MKKPIQKISPAQNTCKSVARKSFGGKLLATFALLGLFLLSSCYTSRNLNYLQTDLEKYTVPVESPEYKIQVNDVLDVKVQSRDPEQSLFFNQSASDNRGLQANTASLFVTGYSVNPEGKISLPIVGELQVEGLTIEEIRVLVQTEIDKYLLNAIASVKLTSFKVSVLGEVQRPGVTYVYNPRFTIFEALSAAGDMNLGGRRKNVQLIRQTGDVTEVVKLDLRDPAIIQSPYYFMHPNDVIYVEPARPNLFNRNTVVFTLLLSTVTTGLLILDYVDSN